MLPLPESHIQYFPEVLELYTVLLLISKQDISKKDRCKNLQDAWHDLQAIEWMQGGRCKASFRWLDFFLIFATVALSFVFGN
jgi:hypothetical protein